MGGLGMGIGIIFLVLVIALAYYLIAGKETVRGESPQEILDRRYARGEIRREEYLRMKEEIIKK